MYIVCVKGMWVFWRGFETGEEGGGKRGLWVGEDLI